MTDSRSRLANPGTLYRDLTFTPGDSPHTIGTNPVAGATGALLSIVGAATDGVGPSAGGAVTITGGAAGAVTGANGGAVNITGGSSGGFANGGAVNITGGSSGGTGGTVTIAPGTGLGAGQLRLGSTVTCTVLIGAAAGTLAFFGGAGSTKPTVSGSRGGNAALADLLTKLAALGLLTDSTTI